MELAAYLIAFGLLTAPILLWARLSKLDLGLSSPNFRKAEPWILVYLLWCVFEWGFAIFVPFEVDPDWLAFVDQRSLVTAFISSIVIAPITEELLFRGAMFSAFLRRYGIRAAVLVPSIPRALLHYQYDWLGMAFMFVSGCLLAIVRWKGASLYLPIGLHAVWNLLVLFDYYGLPGSPT